MIAPAELARLLALPAGPELNAAVAEHVFGWRWYRWEPQDGLDDAYRGRFLADPAVPARHGGIWWPTLRQVPAEPDAPLHEQWAEIAPEYSTDIAAAWQVVDALVGRGWFPTVQRNNWPTEPWECNAVPPLKSGGELRMAFGRGTEPTLAICRAALAALSQASEKSREQPQ